MELYAQVRRYVAVDHHSQREAARHFGISRDMVAKMMGNAQPPGYRRTAPVARPKLDPFMGWITEILKADQQKHRKQRHTAQRIFERLKAEHGYTGGYQKILAKVQLLIIDELGFVPLTKTGAELLFEVFSQRHERGATLVTSNLPFDEWTEIFGSQRLTGALLDRLTHHVHLLTCNGDSYRLADAKRRRAKPETKPTEEL